MYKQFPSLAEAFLNYFDVDLVTSAEQRDKVARIRYRVYCEEFGYEPPQAFPNKRETDEFDDYSLQCMVTHRRSKRTAGCVRVVCASENHPLPLETHCLESVYVEYLETLAEDRNRICEISRAAVDVAFRRRSGEDHTRLGEYDALDCCHQEQRTFSMLSLAAFLGSFALASLENRPYMFAMMESNLPRLLRRAGILVQQAGDAIEYHGQRAPYFITTQLALENMRDDLHVMYDAIFERLAYNYDAREAVAQVMIG